MGHTACVLLRSLLVTPHKSLFAKAGSLPASGGAAPGLKAALLVALPAKDTPWPASRKVSGRGRRRRLLGNGS